MADFNILGDQMWCEICDIPLYFRFSINEFKKGYGSYIEIRCYLCYKKYTVCTDKLLDDTFAVNLKASMGQYNLKKNLYF